jgi:hypothetical protein
VSEIRKEGWITVWNLYVQFDIGLLRSYAWNNGISVYDLIEEIQTHMNMSLHIEVDTILHHERFKGPLTIEADRR